LIKLSNPFLVEAFACAKEAVTAAPVISTPFSYSKAAACTATASS